MYLECNMSEHKKRAENRAENKNPINFTCGKCGKVHPFNKGYKCSDDDEEEEDEEDEGE